MKHFIRRICAINDKLDKIFDYIMVLLLAGIVLALTAQVVWRYVFQAPITWTEELAKWLFVWSTFLGASWVTKKNMHIEITMIFNRFSGRVQRIIQIFCLLFCMGILGVMIPSSITKMLQQNVVVSNTLHVPMAVLYACAPIGFVLLIMQLLIQLVEVIFDWESYKNKFYRTEE